MRTVRTYKKVIIEKIIKVPVEKLKIPKSIYFWKVDKKYLQNIKDSIEKEGLIHPILTNGSYYINNGRYRFLAMKELGFLEVPCVVVIRRNYYHFYQGE